MLLQIPKQILTIIPSINNLGIYIHFPFCIKECFYCDFYKITNFQNSIYNKIFLDIKKIYEYLEILSYKFGDVDTIYFGGGTPNLMSIKFIEKILNEILKKFSLAKNLEITFEINPGVINYNYLKNLKNLGINRISCGVQSFNLFGLRIMGRTHSIQEIFTTINYIEKIFDNYNIDLLALYPYHSIDSLKNDLKTILSINPPHISYYLIDIDKKVNYPQNMLKKIKENYQNASIYYQTIQEFLTTKYVHYEVSNFAHKGYYCKHNLKYWYYYDYIGIGPSAVSKITVGNKVLRIEILPNSENLNVEEIEPAKQLTEKIMLSLRTKWGIILQNNNYKKVLKIKDFKNYNTKILDILKILET